jgi:hypothetical protein
MEHTYEVLKGQISKEELSYLNEMVIKYSNPDPKPGFEGSGLIDNRAIENDENYPRHIDPDKTLIKVKNIVESYFLKKYKMLGTLEFSRIFGVTMFEGSELPAHRDEDANNDGVYDGRKRSHVCSLILNDDYEGGELVFPDQNESLKSEAGDMVVFPGYYVSHGVSKITKGTRRVILVFFYDVLPKIIWQTHEWDYEDLPDNFKKSSMTWRNLNPTWDYRYVNAEERAKQVEAFSPELYKYYPYMSKVAQADIWRYLTVYENGGFYADMDSACSSPLDFIVSLVPKTAEFVSTPLYQNKKMNNANFGALVKNNICVKELIENILRSYTNITLKNILDAAKEEVSVLDAIEHHLLKDPLKIYYSSLIEFPDLVWAHYYGAIHGDELKELAWEPNYTVDYYGKEIPYLDLVKENNWSIV